MKAKTKILLTSLMSVAFASSLIVGSTYALFTSEAKTNIAVTSGTVKVEANVANVKLYRPQSIDVNTYASTFAMDEKGNLIGSEIETDGESVSLKNFIPGDKLSVQLNISSKSTVSYQYRISVAQKDGDKDFYENLLVGIDNVYYSEYVSEWTLSDAVSETEATIDIIMPAYLSNQFAEKSCNITFKVEAIQGNAYVSNESVAKKVYPVYSQEELSSVLSEDLDKDATIVLMQKWNDVNFETEKELDINVKGCDANNVTVNALNSSIDYYVAMTERLDIEKVASNSFHMYGKVNSLGLKHGHVVVEETGKVEKVTIAPSANQAAKLEAGENSKVNFIVIDAADESSMVTVEINSSVVVDTVEIQNAANNVELTYEERSIKQIINQGNIIENVDGKLIFTSVALIEALKTSGKIILAANINLDQAFSISKDVEIELDLNGYTLTQNVSSYNMVNNGASLTVTNGNYIINQTSSSITTRGFYVSGSLTLFNINLMNNLKSTRPSSSQTFYGFYGYNNLSINLIDTSVVNQVESKTNENCKISIYGIYAQGSTVTVNGGSITADHVVSPSFNGVITLADVDLNYAECGINMRYNGGTVVMKSGVTFSGELSKPAIIITPSRNNAQLDDSESGYEWEFAGTISDCSSYNPIIECYQSGNVVKHVYTNEYPEHTYDEYEYDEWWSGYVHKCSVCGNVDYSNSIPAGESEQFYYPVKDESSLKNAALNATNYIKLENDITINSYWYELKDGCVLDLNGYTITVNNNIDFKIEGNNITIKNGNIRRPENKDYSYGLKITRGNVTVEGINIDSGINVAGGATATIRNCNITLSVDQAFYHVCAQTNSKVTVENCTMIRTNAGKANNYFWVENGSSMSVTGCTFESTCNTTYYNKGGVAPTFDFEIVE